MIPEIQKIKGLHPGIILDKILKDQEIEKKNLCSEIREFPQTLSAVCKTKRSVTPLLSIKLGKYFGIDESYFAVLQAEYDVASLENKLEKNNKPKLRKVLFWDTDFEKINWEKNKISVIRRVFERGNDFEKQEVIDFYGQQTIDLALKNYKFFLNESS